MDRNKLSHLLTNLHDILILQHMIPSTPLRLMFSTPPPNQSVTKLINQMLMQAITKLLDGRVTLRMQDDGLLIIGHLAFRFSIDPNHVTPRPNFLHQLLQIPLIRARDRHVVRHLIEYIQFFDRQRVNFIKHVQHGDITPIPFHYVNKLIHGDILPQNHLGATNLILLQHHPTNVNVHTLRLSHELLIPHPALLALHHPDVRWRLIDPNAEGKQFRLDYLFVSHGFRRVEHDEYEIARSRGGYDLTTAAFTIRGTFNNTWEVEDLDARSLVFHRAGYARQGREFVRRRFATGAGEGRQ
mmetsp:Transcript_2247/g.2888  ORF Transcript_2247/g.2888 Transcript_2247/m.2888 type:complete len:298 (+) Transcript_2247:79-972(+)